MKLNRRRVAVAAVIGLGLVVAMGLASKLRFSTSMHGTIVEEVSGSPVAGAVIVATWTIVTSVNAMPIRYLRVQEARSDAQGRFQLKAWGPVFEMASLAADQPKIEIFRVGFLPSTTYRGQRQRGSSGSEVIRLARYDGPSERYAQIMALYGSTVVSNFFMPPFRCEWRHIPALLAALKAAEATIERQDGQRFLPAELWRAGTTGCLDKQPRKGN